MENAQCQGGSQEAPTIVIVVTPTLLWDFSYLDPPFTPQFAQRVLLPWCSAVLAGRGGALAVNDLGPVLEVSCVWTGQPGLGKGAWD